MREACEAAFVDCMQTNNEDTGDFEQESETARGSQEECLNELEMATDQLCEQVMNSKPNSTEPSQEEESLSVAVTWGNSAVTLSISGGDANGAYDWGLAETEECNGECWTGEDCYQGYTMGDGSALFYCHPVENGFASLVYNGD